MGSIPEKYLVRPLPNDGRRGYRLEIDEFMEDNDMVNLFLLALIQLQMHSLTEVDGKPNWLNYYALGSIHGLPTENWNSIPNNVNNSVRGAEFPNYGYCHHDIDTFPTWHRPYMMMFEYMVYDEMLKQANKYQKTADKNKYLDAAARFRLPYWDPLMPRNLQAPGARFDTVWGLPQILKRPSVFLRHPDNPETLYSFDNPMYKFVFPENWEDPSRRVPRAILDQGTAMNSRETMRTPITVVSRAGATAQQSKIVSVKTDNDFLDLTIQRQNVTHASKFWKMLNPDEVQIDSQGNRIMVNQVRPWSFFANHNAKPPLNGLVLKNVSLESWHDGIHNMIGTGRLTDQQGNRLDLQNDPNRRPFEFVGQMADPAVAAFEPMFWMHHNNIDRILSLYQAIYGKNVDDGSGPNDPKLLKYKLVPFLKDKDMHFWTSDDGLVKNYWSPGFGTPGSAPADARTIREKTLQYLTSTYLWTQNNGPAEQRAVLPESWPRNLSNSEALTGKPAKPGARTGSSIRAIVSNNGVPTLVQGVAADARPITIQHTMSQVASLTPEMPLLQASPPSLQTKPASKGGVAAPHAQSAQSVISQPDTKPLPMPAAASPNSAPATANGPASSVAIAGTRETQQSLQVWDAHVRVRKYAFDGSFSVHVFIGYVKDDQPERYLTKKNEVGFAGVFARSLAGLQHCGNCQRSQQEDYRFSDVIPLTSYLQDYLETNPRAHELIEVGQVKTLKSLNPEHVVPFLKEHLQWRMTDLGSNNLTGDEQQAGLCVAVSNRTYTMPTEANLAGVYGPETMDGLHVITEGKPGGRGYTYEDGSVVEW